MLSFHGSHQLKRDAIYTMRHHREMEAIAQGEFWQDGKGCAVGCIVAPVAASQHGISKEAIGETLDWHEEYERILGIPYNVAEMVDDVFEKLPSSECLDWPEEFLKAVPVGIDLSFAFPAVRHFERFLRIAKDDRHERARLGRKIILSTLKDQACFGVTELYSIEVAREPNLLVAV